MTKAFRFNVRVIAATNRPLDEALRDSKLRKDLYYRLNVFKIPIPPLRDRLEDVDVLAPRFIEEVNRDQGKEVDGLDSESLAALKSHGWPGNVRELRNAIEQAVVMRERGRITLQDLPEEVWRVRQTPGSFLVQMGTPMREVQRQLLAVALEANNGNRTQAARALGISRRSLYDLLPRDGVARRRNKPRT